MGTSQSIAITSADPSLTYLSYLPLASKSFSIKNDSDFHLVLNLPKYFSHTLVDFCGYWSTVKVLALTPGIDIRVQSKISRMWTATHEEYRDKFVTLCDLDMVQLDDARKKVINRVQDNSLIQWGFDHPSYSVSPDIGKWPMDGTSAKGNVFNQIVNPEGVSLAQALQNWRSDNRFEVRSNPFNSFAVFSDESLLRDLLNSMSTPPRVEKISRLRIEHKMLSGRLDKADRQPFFAKRFIARREIHEFHGPRPFNHKSRVGKEILSRLEIQGKEYENFIEDLKNILSVELG